MNKTSRVDLLTIALELRLAERDGVSSSRLLANGRLSEMAALLEEIAREAVPSNQNAQVRAMRTLVQAGF